MQTHLCLRWGKRVGISDAILVFHLNCALLRPCGLVSIHCTLGLGRELGASALQSPSPPHAGRHPSPGAGPLTCTKAASAKKAAISPLQALHRAGAKRPAAGAIVSGAAAGGAAASPRPLPLPSAASRHARPGLVPQPALGLPVAAGQHAPVGGSSTA